MMPSFDIYKKKTENIGLIFFLSRNVQKNSENITAKSRTGITELSVIYL